MRQTKATHPWRTQDTNLVEAIQDPANQLIRGRTQDTNLVEAIKDPATKEKHQLGMFKYTQQRRTQDTNLVEAIQTRPINSSEEGRKTLIL